MQFGFRKVRQDSGYPEEPACKKCNKTTKAKTGKTGKPKFLFLRAIDSDKEGEKMVL
jgi:hypothetical protein